MKDANLQDFPESLVCPLCHSQLVRQKENLSCSSCNKDYRIIGEIPNFNQKDEYWCNVSREKMNQLNKAAVESGNWRIAAKELIPEYFGHIEPFDRADAQYLWPITNNSRVLDAGSMWGGVTLPVAQHCKEIFAVDKTIETLAFLKIRADQMGFKNIQVVASPLLNLPFPNDFFDLVILNGVLEWVAFDQPVILEEHWGKRRNDTATYSKDPKQIQVDILQELNRIIKPGGHIYVAIENSIGYQYLAGYPDDHVNLKYVSFLPRFLANAITKWKLNCEYRTYTYSLPGYRSLLKNGGYSDLTFYGAFQHYISPSEIIPIELIKEWKKEVLPLEHPRAPPYAKFFAKFFPRGLLKYFSPSFMIIGRKNGTHDPENPRIIQLLEKVESVKKPSSLKIVKSGGRKGNYHTANFLIYDKNEVRPLYFCKICRNEQYSDILKNEADKLSLVNKNLQGTEINHCVPELLYFGRVDGITFEVMEFIDGKKANFGPHTAVSKKNLDGLDKSTRHAIDFLVKFQRYTKIRDIKTAELSSIVEKQRNILEKKGKLTKKVESSIANLINDIHSFKNISVPICAVHGDYDFYYNILFDENNRATVVDFEHFEVEGLPFLDLATLILTPILMNDRFLYSGLDLISFINKYGLNYYLVEWLNYYAELSGISIKIVKLFAKIATLEQQTKNYPYYRDPFTFPMYNEKIFLELLSFDLEPKE